METMSLFEVLPSSDADIALDRSTCNWPDHSPSTAYTYGCRCPGCRKHRTYEIRRMREEGPLPCAAPGCQNRRRPVQGARYCAEHATSRHYTPTNMRAIVCAVCREPANVSPKSTYPICRGCRQANRGLVKSAGSHSVALETLLSWIALPECELCGTRLGRDRANFAVDHDHQHCPGARGCAECVRGLLCSRCNLTLGQVERLMGSGEWERVVAYIRSRRGPSS